MNNQKYFTSISNYYDIPWSIDKQTDIASLYIHKNHDDNTFVYPIQRSRIYRLYFCISGIDLHLYAFLIWYSCIKNKVCGKLENPNEVPEGVINKPATSRLEVHKLYT